MRYSSLARTSIFTVLILAAVAGPVIAQGEWQLFPRPSFPHTVNAAAIHDDQLIVGGYFTSINDVPAECVARWNGTGWEALGAGATSRVTALATFDGDLYNGHALAEGAVERFDGSSWNQVGTFLVSGGLVYIDAMIEFGGALVVGGKFDEVDGSPRSGFAVYDGSSWSSLGSGPAGPGQRVTSLCTWQGDLVAGGDFTLAGGGAADHVARWTGTNWVPIGAGLPAPAESLVEFDGSLWAGTWASVEGAEVLRWDGEAWVNAGTGISDLTGWLTSYSRGVLDFAEFDGELYLGGCFNTLYTSPGYMAARWNGASWESFGGLVGYGADFAPSYEIGVLVPWGTRLVLAGAFPSVAGEDIDNIVAWNGTNFEHVADDILGLGGSASAVARAVDGIVVAGDFDEAGTLMTGPIARWDGAGWNAYGAIESDRIDGVVNAVEFDGTDLIVGGGITMPDASAASVARFDGASWSRLGDGTEPAAQDLLWFDGSLVAAMVGEVRVFNGAAWDVLGAGLPVDVGIFALAVYQDQLHAAGAFDYSGYPDVAVFRLDAGTWTSLAPAGTATLGRAYTMAVHDGALLVGGDMGGVGEISSPGLIEWDGANWSAKTTSMTNSIKAIASTSFGLIVGGSFRDLDGVDLDGFAIEDPVSGWVAVEGSPTAQVNALLQTGNSLWVGGGFLGTVDGRSPGVVVWHPSTGTSVDEPATVRRAGVDVVPNPFNPQTTIEFETASVGPVSLEIFDQAGRRVRTLLAGERLGTGKHSIPWDGRDDGGSAVASGVYLVQVRADGKSMNAKMALVR